MGIPYAEVIGDPIAHSKSPIIHKFWLEKVGLAGDFRRTHVRLDELQAYLAARRADRDWRGCNVTIPHKNAILPLLDEVIGEAHGAGAVNTILRADDRLIGLNTDVVALKPDIEPAACQAALLENTVVLIGAGGAARAVLQAIREVEGLTVTIMNRDREKAESLLASFGLSGATLPLGARLPSASLIVNASSLGMTGFPSLPVDPADLTGLVYDLVYAPPETELLRAARSKGLWTLDGLHMLIGQARIAFQYFFSFSPPAGTEPELRKMLTR
jgi:shikimate dehydrogenase